MILISANPTNHTMIGKPALCVPNSESFTNSSNYTSKSEILCKLCGVTQKLAAMRNHVGRHLLLHQRGVPDRLLSNSTVSPQ